MTLGILSVGHFEALPCQAASNFIESNALDISTIHLLIYTHYYHRKFLIQNSVFNKIYFSKNNLISYSGYYPFKFLPIRFLEYPYVSEKMMISHHIFKIAGQRRSIYLSLRYKLRKAACWSTLMPKPSEK